RWPRNQRRAASGAESSARGRLASGTVRYRGAVAHSTSGLNIPKTSLRMALAATLSSGALEGHVLQIVLWLAINQLVVRIDPRPLGQRIHHDVERHVRARYTLLLEV